MPVLKPRELITNRVAAIAALHRDTGLPRAELDLSGGVDSAVLLGLLVRAVGHDSVTACTMRGSACGSVTRARCQAWK